MYQSNYGYYPSASVASSRQAVVPQQQPIQMPVIQQTAMLKGHPVSSLEEARATTIDFDGSVFYFPDLANRKIYTKQINMDGTASLNMYELQKMPVITAEGTNYVTKEEFEAVIQELRKGLVQSAPQPQTQSQPQPTQAAPVQYNF